jgi:hypothetical protein
MACPNPLTPDDCHNLNVVLQSCADTAEMLAKMKKCGLPTEEAEMANGEQMKMAQALKAEWFPNNP